MSNPFAEIDKKYEQNTNPFAEIDKKQSGAALANKTLNEGTLKNATPEQTSVINNHLSPQELERITYKITTEQKYGKRFTDQMLEENRKFEYGEDSTFQTANAHNLKAAKWARAKTVGAGILESIGSVAKAGEFLTEAFLSRNPLRKNKLHDEDDKFLSQKITKAISQKTGNLVPESFEEARTVLREKAGRPLEGNVLEQTLQFLDKGGIMVLDNASNLAASAVNPALGMTVMFSNEKQSSYKSMIDSGINEEVSENMSSAYAMLSTPVEYVENIGRVSSAFGVNPKKTLLKTVIKKLSEAGINVAEESVQKFFEDVVFNEAVKLNNEKYGTEIELRDLKEGYGETASGSLAMSTVLEALGLSVKGVRKIKDQATPISLGDATRINKTHTPEEIIQIIENDPVLNETPERAELARDNFTNPTEQNNEALNRDIFEQKEEAEEGGVIETESKEEETEPKKEPVNASEIDSVEGVKGVSEIAQRILKTGDKVKQLAGKATSLSTRLGEQSPEAKMALRRSEQEAHLKTTDAIKTIKPFFDSVKKLRDGMSEAEIDSLNSMLHDGSYEALSELGIEGTNELQSYLKETGKALNREEIENYYPREVNDYEGLADALSYAPRGIMEQAIREAEIKKKRKLTEQERKTVLRTVVRSGFKGEKRTIDKVTPELSKFYKDPLEKLESYIRGSSIALAKKEFLGVIPKESGDRIGIDSTEVTDESIDTILDKILGDEALDPKQQEEIARLIKSRLAFKGSAKPIEGYRRAVSAKYVLKLKTIVKQFGDVAIAVGENSLQDVVGNKDFKALTNELGDLIELSLEDIGVDALDAELQTSTKSKIEELAFKPLQTVDGFNKTILLRSTIANWQRLAKSDQAKLYEKLQEKFNSEDFVNNVITDLKAGKATPDVKFALYSQMADFHPVSHSEHVKLYIDNPSLRPLFYLKSFAYKRYDRFYRESMRDMIDGVTEYTAGAVDGDISLKQDGSSKMAKASVGFGQFLVYSIVGEQLLEEAYNSAIRALGFKEDKDDDEKWYAPYLEEFTKVFPFIDSFAIKKAIEAKDPAVYISEAYDPVEPLGLDTLQDMIKFFSEETELEDLKNWKKDVPFLGEFMIGRDKANED